MSERKAVAQFSLNNKVLWKLKEEAAKEEKTLAVFLRDAVQEYLERKGVDLDLSQGMENWGGDRRE